MGGMKNQTFPRRVGFALNGIRVVFKEEPSFRWQLLAGFGAYVLLGITGAECLWWAIFSLIIGLVLAAELFNSSLERLMDHLHPERHPMIGLAKDCAAGAVFILSFVSLIVLICYLLTYFNYCK